MALLTGMALGAIAALLLTPKTGAEMREELESKSRQAKHKLDQKRSAMKDKVQDVDMPTTQ
jgi:gas vesicle protein